MKQVVTGKIGMWLCVTIATAAAAFAAGQGAQDSERAERILNGSCMTSCHDLRPLQVQALDGAGWTKTINTMVEKGAEVRQDDIPVITQYLVRNHGPVPDGPGKEILLNTCTLCHNLTRVKEHGATAREWQDTLIAMLNEGAPLSDADFAVILRYLARNFPPRQ